LLRPQRGGYSAEKAQGVAGRFCMAMYYCVRKAVKKGNYFTLIEPLHSRRIFFLRHAITLYHILNILSSPQLP